MPLSLKQIHKSLTRRQPQRDHKEQKTQPPYECFF